MTRILFVTYDFPYPLNSGGKNRAYNMMKYARSKEVSIDLLSFVREGFDSKNIDVLKEIGVEDIQIFTRKKVKSPLTISKNIISRKSIFHTLYYDRSFHELLKNIIRKNRIDIVHFESSYTGYYIGNEIRKMGVKQILGTENIEYLLYKDYLETTKNPIKKAALSYQINRFKKEEERMMVDADLCLAVTSDEASYISKITKKDSVVVENAVSVKTLKFQEPIKNYKNILFVGNFTYMPNIQGLDYFIKDVMPKLPEDIKLTVIGRRVSEFVKESSQINAIEYIEDLISEYRKADLLVFPIKIGGGTNYKVLEAMALGVPIVAFPDKINSIGAHEGIEYYAVHNSKEFAETIVRIVNDKNITSKVVRNARKLVEEKYSWEVVGLKLAKVWKELKDEKI